MSLKTIKISVSVLVLLVVIAFSVSKVFELNETKAELSNAEENIAELEKQDILNKEQSKALSDEMTELEEDYLQSVKNEKDRNEEIEEKTIELEEKESEIEKLNKDLQVKRQKEAEEAEEVATKEKQVVKNEPSKATKSEPKSASHKPVTTASSSSSSTGGQTFQVTHYSAYDGTQSGTTRGGTNMANGNIHTSDGYRVIAVDPNTIPFGSIVEVTTSYGATFTAKADDTGGAINGNIIDIAVSSPGEAMSLGRGTATVRVIK